MPSSVLPEAPVWNADGTEGHRRGSDAVSALPGLMMWRCEDKSKILNEWKKTSIILCPPGVASGMELHRVNLPLQLAACNQAWRTRLGGKSIKQAGVSPLGTLTASTPWEPLSRRLLLEQASEQALGAWASPCCQLPRSALCGKFWRLAGRGGRCPRCGGSSFSVGESPPSIPSPRIAAFLSPLQGASKEAGREHWSRSLQRGSESRCCLC
ncbi:uncharacterized protein [Manis javanica]|uniref:uncharacterized protein isoform X1 n=1 Tax=Manis javanica TaxID=9974 RepID=UPI003C6D0574